MRQLQDGRGSTLLQAFRLTRARLAQWLGINNPGCEFPHCGVRRAAGSFYCAFHARNLRTARDDRPALSPFRAAGAVSIGVTGACLLNADDQSALRRRLRTTELQNVVTPFRGGAGLAQAWKPGLMVESAESRLFLDSLAEISRGPGVWE